MSNDQAKSILSAEKREKNLENHSRVLGSLADFEHRLDGTKSDTLGNIHFILYGKYAKPNFVKKNLRQFGGFLLDAAELAKHVKVISESFSINDLKKIASFFGCDCDASAVDTLNLTNTVINAVKSMVKREVAESKADSKSTARSSDKSGRQLEVEILQLKDKALAKETDILELEEQIRELQPTESEKDKVAVAVKTASLETARKCLSVLESRIENKNKLKEVLSQCDTTEDIKEESVCSDTLEEDECENSVAEWVKSSEVANKDKDILGLTKSINSLLSRQTVGNNLMKFDGSSCLKWPIFLSQFEVTSELCGFSDKENVLRLDNSLTGGARQSVELLLCAARTPDEIINILKTKYGRPELIANEVKKTITRTEKVKNGDSFMEFSCVVRNMAALASEDLCRFIDERQLVTMFLGKLPEHLLTQWGTFLITNKIDRRDETLKDFAQWTQQMAEIISRTFPAEEDKSEYSQYQRLPSTSQHKQPVCKVCNTTIHGLDKCPIFKNSDAKKRWKLVEKAHVCFCCLNFHRGMCTNRKQCGTNNCEKFHHPLLHKILNTTANTAVLSCTVPNDSKVILKMLTVKLRGPRGTIDVKAILDEGSTATLLDASTAKLLGLKGANKPLCFRGTGDTYQYDDNSETLQVEIASKNENSKYMFLKDVRTVNNLNLPNQTYDINELSKQYPYIKHVDPSIGSDMQPVLLIGQNNAKLIVSRQVIHPQESAPILSKTSLGWTVHGAISASRVLNSPETTYICCEVDYKLHQEVKHYFKLENFGVTIPKEDRRNSVEEKRALQIATNSIKYNENRYEIALPWKNDQFIFPNSKPMALQRLQCLEKRLQREEEKRNTYRQEIQKLIEKGYAVPVTKHELNAAKHVWYLPHFPVTNANKPGKVRVVFDAAAKVNGKSLNEYILPGPDLLIPLFTVLCNFRKYQIAFTADIREMFNRVEITDEDSYAQCFLWRNSGYEKEPTTYRMKAMIFGTTSSPFLAQFVKNHNARKYLETHKESSEAILNNHYVDDYLHGADDVKHAVNIIKDVIFIHAKAGFEIRNFTTNAEEIRNSLPAELLSDASTWEVGKFSQEYQRVLGMLWNSENDTFTFNLNFHKIDKCIIYGDTVPTKRQVLKTVMSVFDPLGLLSPIIIKAKILLQNIWRAGIGWDDFITDTMMKSWKIWLDELQSVKQLAIPRYIPISNQVEIHTFNDASENAYASVVYVRFKNHEHYKIFLVAAKARVAPLKSLTVPKLELLAAVMGARLTSEIIKAFNLKFAKRYYWTDSRTVLTWINSENKLISFVACRVGEILELTEANEWFWISTNLNSADICTREHRILNFTTEHAWFKGPEFFNQQEDQWPRQNFTSPQIAQSEETEMVNLTQVMIDSICLPIIKSHYSWIRLLRTTSWIKRFIDNARYKADKRNYGEITSTELRWSEDQWQKQVQQACFPVDLYNIRKQKSNKNGRMRKQSLMLDNSGIMRIRGRIYNAEQIVTEREPVILDGRHVYTRLIIVHYHNIYNHQGTETVINELKRNYWIPHVRSVVRNIIYNCWYCKKRNAKPTQPEMGILPKERLLCQEKPFTATGIDFFGPFQVKVGRRVEKRYGVLFTCLTMRAIHVEITHSLTSDACIMAIRRFLARRGDVKTFWTDNGTNFRGASRELLEAYDEIDEQVLQMDALTRKIEWKFIPPVSPHMGGAWERLIGCFKRALMAIMNDRHPTDEVLTTVFVEAEYIVNSRPLTYVSNDAADNCSITPNDILIGRSVYIRSPGVFSEKDLLLRRQWRVAQALTDLFWKRWLKEYLPTLIGRKKWTEGEENLQVGEIVIINDSKLPRGEWPLGVIVKIIPGKDGAVRVAEVKTKSGVFRRPAVKLHRMRVCVDNDEVNTEGGMLATPDENDPPSLTPLTLL